MFYKASFYDRDAHMYLMCRYKVCTRYLDEDYNDREIYFGNDEEVLFVAGQVILPKNASRQEILAGYEKEEQLIEVAKQFANENYPDWENVLAYWDNGKEYTRGLKK